jgi:hypothetical protein
MSKKEQIIKQIEQNIKQLEQNIISCDRCSNTFCNMTNLRRHFHNKKICKPILEDIPIEHLIEKYKVRKGCYTCENCGKEYKSAVGKCKHKKKCLLNTAIIEKKNIEILQDELERKNNELDNLKKQLVSKTTDDKVISTNGGDTNIQKADINTLNNGTINNIVINNYGHEKAMTEKEVQKLINIAMKKCNDINSNPWEALNHTLQQIHFNPKYPENQNLKLTNISSPIMDVYTNDKWRKVPFAEQIKIIIESLMDYIENNQDKVDFSSNYWEELYDKLASYFVGNGNKKYYNKVETSMRCKLYNETQDINDYNKTNNNPIEAN